jgi:hypothetical protein
MHVYIVVAITFAITSSVIAYSKGRNSLGWFLCGLLIGPFALVVAALPPVVRQGQFTRCAACGEIVRAQANVCRYCGRALHAPPTDTVQAEEAV